MKSRFVDTKNPCCTKAYKALAAALCLFVWPLTSAAADIDPFQTDTGQWMSFQRYKDNVKRGLITPQDPPNSSAPVTNPSPDQTSIAAPEATVDTSQPASIVAEPARPVALPVMPGINKGYDVTIDSTAEDKNLPAAKVINLDTTPNLHLQTQNWQDAKDAAREAKERQQGGIGSVDERPPLDIRMSYLPDRKITPIPSPQTTKTHGRASVGAPQSAPTVTAQDLKALPADLAACVAAVDAYKKKQLEALQSDRQTLAALQQAISQLGLQKQLDFMTNTTSALSAQPAQTMPVKANQPLPVDTPTAHP